MTKLSRLTSCHKKFPVLSAGVALALTLITGCVAPSASPTPRTTPSVGVPLPPSSVSDRVLAIAAQELGLPRAELTTLRVNEETWTDGCLGLGQANEGCLQALVEGWQIEVVRNDFDSNSQVNDGRSWFYRTDATGNSVRQSYLDSNLPPSLNNMILAKAAADSGISMEQLRVIDAEPRTWNTCLNLEDSGTACSYGSIFGWRVEVLGQNQVWVYHTDMIGAQVRLNSQES